MLQITVEGIYEGNRRGNSGHLLLDYPDEYCEEFLEDVVRRVEEKMDLRGEYQCKRTWQPRGYLRLEILHCLCICYLSESSKASVFDEADTCILDVPSCAKP